MSPFKERTRQFWKNAGDDKCQWESYTEEKGFKDCGKPAKHIHHITPESKSLTDGNDPERNVGMPLCERHHVRNEHGEIYNANSSFHPDVAQAYKRYPEWKQKESHMRAIGGRRRTPDYSTSPFAEVSKEHVQKAKRGERITTGTEETDRYYERKMIDKATRHIAESGKKKPNTSPHPKFNPKRRKRWFDGLFEDK